MKKTRRLFVLFMCLLAVNAAAQPKASLSISYFGETLTHPGIMLGFDISVAEKDGHQLLLGTQMGLYSHRRNHRGFLVWPGLTWRHTGESGFSVETSLSPGYMYSRPLGDPGFGTYRFSDDGESIERPSIEEVRTTGYHSFSPAVQLGMGYDLGRTRTNHPLRLFSILSVFGQYPFNGYMLPHIAGQVGLSYAITTQEGAE